MRVISSSIVAVGGFRGCTISSSVHAFDTNQEEPSVVRDGGKSSARTRFRTITRFRTNAGRSGNPRVLKKPCKRAWRNPSARVVLRPKIRRMKDWDVSEITDFSWAFSGYTHVIENNGEPTGRANFNADISNWRPTKAKRMDHMFYYAGFQPRHLQVGVAAGWRTSNNNPGCFKALSSFKDGLTVRTRSKGRCIGAEKTKGGSRRRAT